MMKASIRKLVLTALAVAAFTGVLFARPGPALAATYIQSLSAQPVALVGATSDISFTIDSGDPADVLLFASASGSGYFSGAAPIRLADNSNCLAQGIGTQVLIWYCPAADNIKDTTGSGSQTVLVRWLCISAGQVNLTLRTDPHDASGPTDESTTSFECKVPTPVSIQLTASPPSVTTCPASVTLQARVVDLSANPLPDGTLVNFASTGGTLTAGFAYTINGIATTTLEVSNPPPFSITVLATSSGLQKSITINVSCPPVPLTASTLTVSAAQTHVPCGKQTLVTAYVTDQAGKPVADGLVVKFVASSGTLDPAEGKTVGGAVIATYKAPDTPAIDLIQAAAGPLFESVTIFVECTVTPTATATPGGTPGAGASGPGVSTGAGTATAGAQGGAAGANGGVPSIRPPSTGDGGLAGHRELSPLFALALPFTAAAAAGAVVLLRRRSA